MAAALFLACGMVAQYRAQRAAAAVSAPRGAGGGPVELLTFEMLHDPHCKADKHCHSACRMVCDEVNSGQGAREHAATLISFGCCLSAPVITKQAGSPVQLAPRGAASPLQLLSVRQPAKEQMLFEVNAKGHIRFDRPADTRKDSVAVHVLRDRHSLAADLRDLEREQAALKKRVSKLRIQDVLPFRVAALQKSMVNQTPLALTVMAPRRSAPVPLKVYQASFVVKVRVVLAQPSAAPLPCPIFPAPLPVSVGSSRVGENCCPVNSSSLRRRLLL